MIEVQMTGADQLGQAFADVANHIRDFRPRIWPPVNARFTELMIEHFESAGATGASGAWAELGENYGAWKNRHYPGEPILSLTGNLRRSLLGPFNPDAHYTETADMLERGTQIGYAVYHQYGTKNMPPRPPIDFTDEQAESLMTAARDAFAEVSVELGFEVTFD